MDIKAPCYILAQGNKNRILIHNILFERNDVTKQIKGKNYIKWYHRLEWSQYN